MIEDWLDDEDIFFDPASALVALDANALDRKGRRDDAIDLFLQLIRSGQVNCWIGRGVAEEVKNHDSPLRELITPDVRPPKDRSLTASQHIARIRVRSILCGNAKVEKHAADAVHVSEAAEAGCSHFISYDGRILRKRQDLETLAIPTMRIVTLEEFLAVAGRELPDQRSRKP